MDTTGCLLRRGDQGYEQARRRAVWNARTPERFPEEIVLADSEADVVRAVRRAGERDMRIGVRSGGHSWAGSHLRDGGMLLDCSRLRSVRGRRERDDGRRPARLSGERARHGARRCGAVLPGRSLRRRRGRRLPAAGRLRLERARARSGLHERAGDRRRNRRRRARSRRLAREPRSAVGCPRSGTGVLRRGHALSPEPSAAAEGRGERRCSPIR